jgi:chaperonin cofactor prefoldin
MENSIISLNTKIALIQRQQKDYGKRIKQLKDIVSKIYKEHLINH